MGFSPRQKKPEKMAKLGEDILMNPKRAKLMLPENLFFSVVLAVAGFLAWM